MEGARHATKDVLRFVHNDLESLEDTLQAARSHNRTNGVFVVLESLYSMDSDCPDLGEALRIVHEHEGILILDVAHDFAAMGTQGLGLLESVVGDDWPDVIMGSFSKTFATNGGFVASSQRVTDYLRAHSSPLVFSNAISPLQVALASAAFDIAFSEEGQLRREALQANVRLLRGEMERRGLRVAGTTSPIVPVFVGSERVARVTSRYLQDAGLLANLVEYPAVPPGTARFRFQAMSTHEHDCIVGAAEIMAAGKKKAEESLSGKE
jgi:7-keto-8-aminopelargonate synthetase-like enzyme